MSTVCGHNMLTFPPHCDRIGLAHVQVQRFGDTYGFIFHQILSYECDLAGNTSETITLHPIGCP